MQDLFSRMGFAPTMQKHDASLLLPLVERWPKLSAVMHAHASYDIAGRVIEVRRLPCEGEEEDFEMFMLDPSQIVEEAVGEWPSSLLLEHGVVPIAIDATGADHVYVLDCSPDSGGLVVFAASRLAQYLPADSWRVDVDRVVDLDDPEDCRRLRLV